MKTNTKANLNNLHMSDIYSLMLFILYKLRDDPNYATLSELCYLLDGPNLTRLFAYFAGKTVKIPTEDEFSILSKALLLYQYINLDGNSLTDAQKRLGKVGQMKMESIVELYLRIIPIMQQYNIDRAQVQHGN